MSSQITGREAVILRARSMCDGLIMIASTFGQIRACLVRELSVV